MSYCKTCPYCGANLDPGEHCDCLEEKLEEKGQAVEITYPVKEERNVS